MFNRFMFAMFVATFILLTITRLAAKQLIRHHHAQKVDFFRHYPIQAGDIVFMGDSLTDGARWDEMFPGVPIKNRGINADLSPGYTTGWGRDHRSSPRHLFFDRNQ